MIVEYTVIGEDRRMTMEDIMSRDQRTTSHRVLDRLVCGSTPKSTSTTSLGKAQGAGRRYVQVAAKRIERADGAPGHSRCHSRLVPAFYDDRGIRSRHGSPVTATTWLRLGSLLVTLLVVSVHGAPTMNLEDRRLSSPPKWVNPCGLAAEVYDGDLDVVRLRDEQLLDQVVVPAKTALMHAELFRENYVKRTFNIDYDDMHSTWKDNHYDWLPGPREIPKQLGEKLDKEYLDKLELDTALLDAYEYMQKYAVGLEQIVWDQEDHRLEFRKQFKETDDMLRTVLCELQVALVERGVPARPDVTRDAMSSEYRAMSSSATYRDLRDWLIFRDYMNGLEYVVQVFEHLRSRLES
ncbi:hypothetical protein KM043_006557 [Ampulex compressa]|nr:hypothetical protein KM043_006557 [Ampulex compressa]